MNKILKFLLLALLFSHSSFAVQVDTNKVYGVTIDAISNLPAIVTSLSLHCYKPTTRIVFDEFVPATNYVDAVNQIHNVSFIMGEILDSYYLSLYNLAQYQARTTEYLNLLGSKVDIWEIGNEINGEWLGNTSDVVAKMNAAYSIIKTANKKTELTLYYNKNCWSNPANEMFRWVNENISTTMKNNLDYVLVSYYEDGCNNLQPNWQQVFDSLHAIFPNSKLGIGECGTTTANKKATYINRYYRMNITTPKYVGGYFWWYYKQDCVPNTTSLWTVLNSALASLTGVINEENIVPENALLDNYPNPFNPVTKIRFDISGHPPYPPSKGEIKISLKVYDLLGKEISTLVNEQLQPGTYEVTFNGSNLPSGAYFYRLTSGNDVITKKMTLIK
ncbi:MAG TPA: T9SS type A sorting domain-containing protein [Ignavibacteria bacterium]